MCSGLPLVSECYGLLAFDLSRVWALEEVCMVRCCGFARVLRGRLQSWWWWMKKSGLGCSPSSPLPPQSEQVLQKVSVDKVGPRAKKDKGLKTTVLDTWVSFLMTAPKVSVDMLLGNMFYEFWEKSHEFSHSTTACEMKAFRLILIHVHDQI